MTGSLQIPPQETALLVIDMQNGFVHPESAMGQSPSGTGAQQEIVPVLIKLVGFARENQIPILWSQQEHFPEDRTRVGKRIQPHSVRQGFLPCTRGTWEVDFYSGLQAHIRPEDHIVSKHRASVFYNTNLESKLKMLGVRFLLIAVCNTEFCVESTVRDAYARDYELIVVRDCVAGIQRKFHEHSLEVFQAYFGEVLSFAELPEVFKC
jgi:ureidoacrylate peracid hydrolase